METKANTPTACRNASGEVISLDFSGTSDDCDDLRIEVYDAATGDLLLTGPVSFNGSNWTVSFSVQNSDFAAGDIACDGELEVKLKCRDRKQSRPQHRPQPHPPAPSVIPLALRPVLPHFPAPLHKITE